MDPQTQRVVDDFHNLYYHGPPGDSGIHKRTYWMGVRVLKCPLDLWMYQEILFELRPDLIIETGTCSGGSALFMAHLLDILGKGEIITIDIEAATRPTHPRIRYVTGSSSDEQLIADVLKNRPANETRLVILDSDHSEAHVAKELNLLAPYVTKGSYLIVEDSNVNGHPTHPKFGPGPYEAVEAFLKKTDNFIIDPTREKFLLTFNPRGFLKRVS